VAFAPGGDPEKVPEGVVRHAVAQDRREAGVGSLLLAFFAPVKRAGQGLQETVTCNCPAKTQRHRTETRNG
jgi:hypothetical protein